MPSQEPAAMPADRSSRFLARIQWTPAAFWTLVWAAALALHGFRGDIQTDIAMGQWMLQHRTIAHQNWWSAASFGYPFANSEWLFLVAAAALHQVGGRWAVYGAGVAVLALLSLLISVWMPRGRWRWVYIVAVAGLIDPVLPPRPEVLSYVWWTATLLALERYRTTGHRRGLWWAAGTTVLWTQIHASVVLVPLVLIAEWIFSRRDVRHALTGPVLLAIGGTLCRVGGIFSEGTFVGHVLSLSILNTVAEWMPLNPRSIWGFLVIGWTLLTWMQVGHRAWRHRDWKALTWLAAGTFALCAVQRLVPYAAIGFLLLWQPIFAETQEAPAGNGRHWDNAILAVGAVLAVWAPVLHVGFFAPSWPPALLALLHRDHATNIVAPSGDSLNGAGLLPWANGQQQFYANQPWWPAWVATVRGQASPAAFVARYDPSGHWIVWPLATAPGFGPLALPAPWHLVWQGTMRWPGAGTAAPTGVWTR